MKTCLLILFCLVASAAAQSDLVDENTSYRWMLDMFRVQVDLFVIGLVTPIFWILSFFAGNQESYGTWVYKFMNKKWWKLSSTYVGV